MKAKRASYPLKSAPLRLGYPKLADNSGQPVRILCVVPPAKADRTFDGWTAWWMDRQQVAGATFALPGHYAGVQRCASLEAPVRGDGTAIDPLTNRDRKARVPWGEVPDEMKAAVLAAIAEWNASAEYVPIGGRVKRTFDRTPLDKAGLDCPTCGLEDGLAMPPPGRPMKANGTARAECEGCEAIFTVVRDAGGDLVVLPGALA